MTAINMVTPTELILKGKIGNKLLYKSFPDKRGSKEKNPCKASVRQCKDFLIYNKPHTKADMRFI